jgi:hypothetical protein
MSVFLFRAPLLATFVCLILSAAGSAAAQQPQEQTRQLDQAALASMMDEVIKYYDEARPSDGRILEMLQGYEKNKDGLEYKKLRFLFDTHQKVTTSLNDLIDVLYIYLKLGGSNEPEINQYIYSRTKNIITFLNNMVYFLTGRNQEIELAASSDVQKLYENYLVRLTTLLYELNQSLTHFQK